jgi:hypothetical protein
MSQFPNTSFKFTNIRSNKSYIQCPIQLVQLSTIINSLAKAHRAKGYSTSLPAYLPTYLPAYLWKLDNTTQSSYLPWKMQCWKWNNANNTWTSAAHWFTQSWYRVSYYTPNAIWTHDAFYLPWGPARRNTLTVKRANHRKRPVQPTTWRAFNLDLP